MKNITFIDHIVTSVRILVVTLVICCIIYPLAILLFAQYVVPFTANGSLISTEDGRIIGSLALCQKFTGPEYLWPRPSAVDYNAAASGGSNLSPAGMEIAERARKIIATYGDLSVNIPAELVSASGSGLDPDITLSGALFQVSRIAASRSILPGEVTNIIMKHARTISPLSREKIVNVLAINLDLDSVVYRRVR